MTLETAARLTALRKDKGLSQEELAEKLGVSRQAVSKWERAESSPDTDNLIALARLYGVTLDELIFSPAAPDPDPVLMARAESEPAAEYVAEEEESREASADADGAPADGGSAQTSADFTDDPLPNGSFYEHQERERMRRLDTHWASFPYPILVTVIYLVLGFCFHWWHPGWIIFLTIPLFYMPRSERSYLRLLGNPIMVTIIYLLLGTLCNLWHPGWLVFLLIPLLQWMR